MGNVRRIIIWGAVDFGSPDGGRIDNVMSVSAGGNQPLAVYEILRAIVHVRFLFGVDLR